MKTIKDIKRCWAIGYINITLIVKGGINYSIISQGEEQYDLYPYPTYRNTSIT